MQNHNINSKTLGQKFGESNIIFKWTELRMLTNELFWKTTTLFSSLILIKRHFYNIHLFILPEALASFFATFFAHFHQMITNNLSLYSATEWTISPNSSFVAVPNLAHLETGCSEVIKLEKLYGKSPNPTGLTDHARRETVYLPTRPLARKGGPCQEANWPTLDLGLPSLQVCEH